MPRNRTAMAARRKMIDSQNQPGRKVYEAVKLTKKMTLRECVETVNEWVVLMAEYYKMPITDSSFRGPMDVALSGIDSRDMLPDCITLWKAEFKPKTPKVRPEKRKRRRR